LEDVMTWRITPWLAVLVLLSACEFTEFEIDMELDGDALVRRLVTRQIDIDHGERILRPYPAELLERLKNVYGAELPEPVPSELTFTGRFQGETPADVGGSGFLAIYEAPMGRLVAYSEQFRGEPNPGVMLERALEAADLWTDIILGWLQGELGEATGWARLRALIDGALRRDLKNLVAIFHVTVGSDSRLIPKTGEGLEVEEEFLLRLLHLFVTRGYLTEEDTPRLFRAMNHSGDRALSAALPILRSAVARATGLGASGDAADRLMLLLGSDDVEASFLRHVETTAPWKAKLADWKADQVEHPGTAKPEPSSLTDDLLSDMVGSSIVVGSEDRLRVRLRCPDQPHRTNGRWDAQERRLEWSGTPAHKGQLPSMVYAFWTEPNTAFQETHFGRIVLRGEALEEYVLWYRGLHAAERGQWDALLAGLRPDGDAVQRLRSFAFRPTDGKTSGAEEAKGQEPQKDPGRGLLLEALETPARTPRP
jgi:hypothetical protein